VAEREGSGVARSAQHAVYVLPHAPHVIERFLAPALDRVTPDAESTQLLVITPDGDTALAIAEAARLLSDRSAAPIVPITGAARGSRLLAARVVPAVAATPSTLVALLRASAIKLANVKGVIIVWADEMFVAREDEQLEVVLAEVPKEASRIVVTEQMTAQVEALVERHLRRAHRAEAVADDEVPPPALPVRYVTTTTSTRAATLRRLLDELDPPSVIVLATEGRAADEARQAVAALGYEGEASVRVTAEPPQEQAALVVLYDLPASAADLAKVAAAEPMQVVALVAPRQVPALRRLTSGAVEPLDVSPTAAKARARDERVRAALRAELQAGFPAREVMALEPLIAEFDGLEIAAAALRLMERERSEARAQRVEAPRVADRAAPPARGGDEAFTRVFLSIGERDGVRPGDLVGAITGEVGITSDRIGKLDIRESHTVADIAASVAPTVVEKMNGVSLKGRRLAVRIDDRPAPRAHEGRREGGREGGRDAKRSGPREGGRGGFGDRPRGGPREGGRGGFGDRGRDRPGRDSAGREGRPSREGRPPRGPGRDRAGAPDRRPPRGGEERPRARAGWSDRPDEGRVPRATHEREEWSDRADRVRNARRPRRDEA